MSFQSLSYGVTAPKSMGKFLPRFHGDWWCPLFLVSFALAPMTEQHGHALTASNLVTLVHLIASVISLTAQYRSVLFHQSFRPTSFPVSSACERSWVSVVGHSPCSPSPLQCFEDDHGVQDHIARLARLGDGTLHEVRTGELGLAHLLCHHLLLQG